VLSKDGRCWRWWEGRKVSSFEDKFGGLIVSFLFFLDASSVSRSEERIAERTLVGSEKISSRNSEGCEGERARRETRRWSSEVIGE